MTEQIKIDVSYNKDKTWTVLIKQPDGTEVKQSLKLEGMPQVAMLALTTRIAELEEKAHLWTQPTPEMVQAGLAEVQRMLDEWNNEDFKVIPDDVTDDNASDMAVFVLQAMASKLPKA